MGWSCGSPHDYDREFCVDRVKLAAFLQNTQPEAAEALALDADGSTQRQFLARLQGEVSKRGNIDVLRHGVRHGPHDVALFYGTPSAANPQARERFEQNRFTVVRQLRYSRDETQRSLDIVLFINGLPVWTAPGLLDTRVRVFDLMRPPQLERVFPALPGPAFGSRSPRESNDGYTGS